MLEIGVAGQFLVRTLLEMGSVHWKLEGSDLL